MVFDAKIYKFSWNPICPFFLLLLVPRIHWQIQCHEAFALFSSNGFIVLSLTFKSWKYFELFFCIGIGVQRHFFPVEIQCSQHCALKSLSFPHWMFLASLPKAIWPDVWGFISGLSILFYMSGLCVSLYANTHHCDDCSFVVSFKNQEVWVLWLCSFFSRLFWLFGVSWDSMWILRWGLFLQKTLGFLRGIALNL